MRARIAGRIAFAAAGLLHAGCGETGGGHPYRIGERIKVTQPPAIGSAAAQVRFRAE